MQSAMTVVTSHTIPIVSMFLSHPAMPLRHWLMGLFQTVASRQSCHSELSAANWTVWRLGETSQLHICFSASVQMQQLTSLSAVRWITITTVSLGFSVLWSVFLSVSTPSAYTEQVAAYVGFASRAPMRYNSTPIPFLRRVS